VSRLVSWTHRTPFSFPFPGPRAEYPG
jgi:hypothetical protein